MEGGCEFDGRAADMTSLTEGLGMLKAGKIDEQAYRDLENGAGPGCGSCSFLGTANTMCCLAEALGMSLPGSATIPANRADRLRAAQESGRQIVQLIQTGDYGPADHQQKGDRKRDPAECGDRRLNQRDSTYAGHCLRGGLRSDGG